MAAILALFQRTLREVIRARMTYALLMGMTGVIFILLLGAQFNGTLQTAPGLDFFRGSIYTALFFITLAGVTWFATAITEEKEEGTLPLLRMTNLTPVAILLGKSTSRLVAALLVLVATSPFTLLAVTLGGISLLQILACYVCVAGYLILLANVALFFSVLSARSATATVATTVLVFVTPTLAALFARLPAWIKGLPYGQYLASATGGFALLGEALAKVDPFMRVAFILSAGFDKSLVGAQFGWSLLLAAICVGLAWLFFDRAIGERTSIGALRLVPRIGSRWQRFAPERTWLVSAVAWKDYHFLHGGRALTMLRWIVYGAIVIGGGLMTWFAGGGIVAIFGSPYPFVFALVGLEVVLAASRILRGEIGDETLGSLATLPYAMSHLVMMKMNGAGRALLPGFVCALVGLTGTIGSSFFESSIAGRPIDPIAAVVAMMISFYFGAQVWLVAHLAAYFSLWMRWGALPLAIAIMVAANVVSTVTCIGIPLLPFVAVVYAEHLRGTIVRWLEAHATGEP